MISQLIETWHIHNRINAYLLTAVPVASLTAAPATAGRTVAQVFAHVHNVRLMWLESAGVTTSCAKLDLSAKLSLATLLKSLEASGADIASMVRSSLTSGVRIKGFKPHTPAFVGYLIAHEAHHRGQVVLALKASGTPLDRKVLYGLWEWGVR
jgi:uncharacterized damage-inducible protein DinB